MNLLVPKVAALLALPLIGGCFDDQPPRAVGTLERDRLELIAEASEPVIARPVEEGAFVEAGSLLIELDPTRLDAEVAQGESQLARVAARLAELLRGPRKERIAEARARLKGAEANLLAARRLFERAEDLLPRDAVSIELVDERRARFRDALAARDAARAHLAELLEGTTSEELAQAEAAVAEAKAGLAEARVRRERLQVRAPVAGWVDALPYELGERPPPGGTVAIVLAQRAPYARVYVPASIRAEVRAGTRAKIFVEGLEKPLGGRVRTVATDASFTPFFALTERDRGRLVYLAKVDLLDQNRESLPTGLPVEVEFELEADQPTSKP